VTLPLNRKRHVALALTVLAVAAWTIADIIYPNRFPTLLIFGGFVTIFVGVVLSFLAYKEEKKIQLSR
jgi:hypothetical protein